MDDKRLGKLSAGARKGAPIWEGKLRRTLSTAAAVVFLLGIGATPAQANTNDLTDVNSVISRIVPSLMDETDVSSARVLVSRQKDSLQEKPEGQHVVVDIAPDSRSEQDLPNMYAEGVNIEVLGATSLVARDGGIDVLTGSDESSVTYVQPTFSGIRLLTAVADASAPTEYAYRFDVPRGTTLKHVPQGWLMLGPDGHALGALGRAWAIDAAGKAVSTEFRWQDGVLTQFVHHDDPSTVYPVLADPNWTYSYTYSMTNTTVQSVKVKLKDTCFNCYFPVEGAPHYFPTSGQFLPLVVRPFDGAPGSWNFNCVFDAYYYETYAGSNAYFGFDFFAAEGHVDGLGSTISFSFNPVWDQSNAPVKWAELVVNAWIVNDFPGGIPRGIYQFGARANWQEFANNLNT